MPSLPEPVLDALGADARSEPLAQGRVAHTVAVAGSRGRGVLKTATDELSRRRLGREADVLQGGLPPTAFPPGVPEARPGTGPGPELPRLLARAPDAAWILVSWLDGSPLRAALRTCPPAIRPGLVAEYARTLAWLHRSPVLRPVDGEPWLERRLADATRNLREGRIARDDLEPEHRDLPLADLFQAMRQARPPAARQTPIHGDVAADNLLVRGTRITGLCDWSEAGIGDPHQDLALAWRVLQRLEDPDRLWALFLEAYGDPVPELARIRFYLLLDEFM